LVHLDHLLLLLLVRFVEGAAQGRSLLLQAQLG
jgi:hypothetical protein